MSNLLHGGDNIGERESEKQLLHSKLLWISQQYWHRPELYQILNILSFFCRTGDADRSVPLLERGVLNNMGRTNESTCKRFYSYLCSRMFGELVILAVISPVIAYVPYLFSIHERPIPYQVTAAGDIILDFSLMNPLVPDTVPESSAFILTVILPFVIQCTVALCVNRQTSHIHSILCAYLIAFGSTGLVTESIKRYVGRLRPNTYEYCEFSIETLECGQNSNLNWRVSFPSGHSSVAFCGCTLLTWYLFYTLNIPYNFTVGRRLIVLICISPMLLAFAVAASRIYDNYHFVGDGE